jgi:plasmid maintenance system killer protein
MIKTFLNDAAESIWQGSFTRKLPNQIQAIARRKLRMLNNARTVDDLRIPPANRLEKLPGVAKGNGVSVSTTSGGFTSSGATAQQNGLKFAIITDWRPHYGQTAEYSPRRDPAARIP